MNQRKSHEGGALPSSSSPPIPKAQYYDIILQDGSTAKKHSGNIMLCNLIIERQAAYKIIAPTDRNEKNNYICHLIGDIEKTGGRFLRDHPSGEGYEVGAADFVYRSIQRRLLRNKSTKKLAVPQALLSPMDCDPNSVGNDVEGIASDAPCTIAYNKTKCDEVKEGTADDAPSTTADKMITSDADLAALLSRPKRVTRSSSRKGNVHVEQSNSVDPKKLINKYMVIRGKKSTTIPVTVTTSVPNLIGNSVLRLIPSIIPQEDCNRLAREIEDSDLLRQYSRRGGAVEEPRLHALAHPHATSSDMKTPGLGYSYKDVHMKAIPIKSFPSLLKIAEELRHHLKVSDWSLGADCIIYATSADGIGFHADNSQGERVIACLIVSTGVKQRKVIIKPGTKKGNQTKFHLQLGQGSVYVMNGEMQQHYLHSVPKETVSKNSNAIDYRRIVVVLREGVPSHTIDNGHSATLQSRLHRPSNVQFGHIPGVEEGASYSMMQCVSTYGHRTDRRGVNGNRFEGCDAIIMSKNNPALGELDDFITCHYSCNSQQGARAMLLSFKKRLPIRVFRSSSLKNSVYAPEPEGRSPRFRYDGIYFSIGVMCKGVSLEKSFDMPMSDDGNYLFELRRCSTASQVKNTVLRDRIQSHNAETPSDPDPEECKAGYYEQQKKRKKGGFIPHGRRTGTRPKASFLDGTKPMMINNKNASCPQELKTKLACILEEALRSFIGFETTILKIKMLHQLECPTYYPPTDAALKAAHYAAKQYIPTSDMECVESGLLARKYCLYWKPDQVKAIILAESHAHTPTSVAVGGPTLRGDIIPNYDGPRGFVAHVYNLAYGEGDATTGPVESNKGSPQFWKLLSVLARGMQYYDSGQFSTEISKGTQSKNKELKEASMIKRLNNKLDILKELKAQGIWLVDTNVFGWHIPQPTSYIQSRNTMEFVKEQRKRPPIQLFNPSLVLSWELYTKHLIHSVAKEGHLKFVLPLGKRVGEALSLNRLQKSLTVDGSMRAVVEENPPAPDTHMEGGYEKMMLPRIVDIFNRHKN